MKERRQGMILSIISEHNVETQDELAELLKSSGFAVTQATVSRDIRELNLTKVIGETGKQKYIALDSARLTLSGSAYRLIKESVVSVDSAGNLLVVKTRTGKGMAVAFDIDEMHFEEILGTIGSDDVVFCAVKTPEQAETLKTRFLSILR